MYDSLLFFLSGFVLGLIIGCFIGLYGAWQVIQKFKEREK